MCVTVLWIVRSPTHRHCPIIVPLWNHATLCRSSGEVWLRIRHVPRLICRRLLLITIGGRLIHLWSWSRSKRLGSVWVAVHACRLLTARIRPLSGVSSNRSLGRMVPWIEPGGRRSTRIRIGPSILLLLQVLRLRGRDLAARGRTLPLITAISHIRIALSRAPGRFTVAVVARPRSRRWLTGHSRCCR